MDVEYTRRGQGNLNTVLGAIGTAGAVGILNGGLGGLFGGPRNVNGNGECSENHLVDRYEASQQARIAQLETEVKLRDSTIYTDQKSLALYQYIDGQIKEIRGELSDQRVHNQRTEDSFVLARQDLATVKAELDGKIKMEAEKRCCGDNSIVTYANATFYPKQVADVTVGTATTAQSTYNPLPKCGDCCCSN